MNANPTKEWDVGWMGKLQPDVPLHMEYFQRPNKFASARLGHEDSFTDQRDDRTT